jgi:hypothetical protein
MTRPRLSSSSIASRYGSQKLVDGTRWGFPGSEALHSALHPVVTSLAGFAGDSPFPSTRRPHTDSGGFQVRTGCLPTNPGLSCSMRRNRHPSRPSAITCCLLSSLKTLLMLTKATAPPPGSTSQASFSLAGFQVTIIGRIRVTAEVQVSKRTVLASSGTKLMAGLRRRTPTHPLRLPNDLFCRLYHDSGIV